jgi:predicted DNA-binding transcriptional regulator AlpA
MQGVSVADVSFSHLWSVMTDLSSRVSNLERTATQKSVNKDYERDLTLPELATELNKSYTTVWRMVRKRRLIPVDNSSRTLRFRRKDVEQFKNSVTS